LEVPPPRSDLVPLVQMFWSLIICTENVGLQVSGKVGAAPGERLGSRAKLPLQTKSFFL
jgi:hypothetical protein